MEIYRQYKNILNCEDYLNTILEEILSNVSKINLLECLYLRILFLQKELPMKQKQFTETITQFIKDKT